MALLSDATYFATAATLQGENSCGKVVDGAIQLKDNGKVGTYKIVCKNKTESELKGDFVHYLTDTLIRLQIVAQGFDFDKKDKKTVSANASESQKLGPPPSFDDASKIFFMVLSDCERKDSF